MDLLPSELDAKIQEHEQSLAAAQQEVEDALQKLQKDYAEARRQKARVTEIVINMDPPCLLLVVTGT